MNDRTTPTIIRHGDGSYEVQEELDEFLAKTNVCNTAGRISVSVCPASTNDVASAPVRFGTDRAELATTKIDDGCLVFVLNEAESRRYLSPSPSDEPTAAIAWGD